MNVLTFVDECCNYWSTRPTQICFGLAKQAVHISDLFELAHTIDNTTVTGVNVSQLCGLHDGSVLLPTYDWASFFDKYFKKLPGEKEYHHFHFSSKSSVSAMLILKKWSLICSDIQQNFHLIHFLLSLIHQDWI